MIHPEQPQKINPETATEEEYEAALKNVQRGLRQRKVQDRFMHLPDQPESLLDKLHRHDDEDLEEDDGSASGPRETQRSIINSELFWHGRFLNHDD